MFALPNAMIDFSFIFISKVQRPHKERANLGELRAATLWLTGACPVWKVKIKQCAEVATCRAKG